MTAAAEVADNGTPLTMTQEAYRDLSAAVPGPYWAIVKEVGAVE